MIVLKRIILATALALALTSTVACLLFWVRSYWVTDHIDAWRQTVRDATKRRVFIRSSAGVLEIEHLKTVTFGTVQLKQLTKDAVHFHHESRPRHMLGHWREAFSRAGFGYWSYTRAHRGSRSKGYYFASPYWAPFIPLALLSTLLIRPYARALLRRFVSKPSRCRKCSYDLRATPTRCPECGTEVQPTPPQPQNALAEKSGS